MKIRQFVPAVYPRDAVGGHVLRLDEQLRRRGHDAQIVVESHHPETRDRTVGVDAPEFRARIQGQVVGLAARFLLK